MSNPISKLEITICNGICQTRYYTPLASACQTALITRMPNSTVMVSKYAIASVFIAAIAVAVAVAVIIFSGVFNTGPRVPDVKFVGFSPEGTTQAIKQEQTITIAFKVHNNEALSVNNARVVTTHLGDAKFFIIDKPDYIITPAIGGSNGESGDQMITITGASLGNQSAIEDKFTVTLYVDTVVTDSKKFDVRLEQ